MLFLLKPHQKRLWLVHYCNSHAQPSGAASCNTDSSTFVHTDDWLNYFYEHFPQPHTFAVDARPSLLLQYLVITTSQVHQYQDYNFDTTSPLTKFLSIHSSTNYPKRDDFLNYNSTIETIIQLRPKWHCKTYLQQVWYAPRNSLAHLLEHNRTLR